MADLAESVPGYAELTKLCGSEFPSFHDSEIITIQLHRTETSHISIRLVGRRREHKEGGVEKWVPLENVFVTFFLKGVEDLELYGFSHQNVISGLTLENAESGFRLKLWPCYSLAGWLNAEQVRIEFGPAEVTK